MAMLSLDDVNDIRARVGRAHELAAARFRTAFAQQADLPPNERWHVHLSIQAAALVECARYVRLPEGQGIRYRIDGQTIFPYVAASDVEPPAADSLAPRVVLYPHFVVERLEPAVFEYWLIVSELLSTPAWAATKVIATAAEYDDALRRMKRPQIVHALITTFLPSVELRDDGTAMLEVTVDSRFGEQRIERRALILHRNQELEFHSRELIAEDQG